MEEEEDKLKKIQLLSAVPAVFENSFQTTNESLVPREESQLQVHPPSLKILLHLITLFAKQIYLSLRITALLKRKLQIKQSGYPGNWEFSFLNISIYKYKWLLSSRESLYSSDLWRTGEGAKRIVISSGENFQSPSSLHSQSSDLTEIEVIVFLSS